MSIYNEFYGFSEQPFHITPDPRFLFYGERHREAFNHLLFGVKERKGFILVTGEVGAGKTTLCRAFLDELDEGYTTALILNPCLTPYQLVRTILAEFGLQAPGNDRVRAFQTLNEFLLTELEAKRDVVLIIDEAQDLSAELLEQVRLLSNLETDTEKLLQIVLTGQPELKQKLTTPHLRQLRQRIAIEHHVDPLGPDEVGPFLAHRIEVAGGSYEQVFGPGVEPLFYSFSRGIPRLMCLLADRVLLAAFSKQVRPIPPSLVEAKAKEMDATRFRDESAEGESRG